MTSIPKLRVARNLLLDVEGPTTGVWFHRGIDTLGILRRNLYSSLSLLAKSTFCIWSFEPMWWHHMLWHVPPSWLVVFLFLWCIWVIYRRVIVGTTFLSSLQEQESGHSSPNLGLFGELLGDCPFWRASTKEILQSRLPRCWISCHEGGTNLLSENYIRVHPFREGERCCKPC